MSMPAGQPISINNTSELQTGDYIYVEFPTLSFGHVKYGSSQAFQVFAFDTSANKVGVRDESGTVAWFQGGTRDELLRKLSEQTSFSNITIIRPTQSPAQSVGPQVVVSKSQQELYCAAQDLGLPEAYNPISATTFANTLVGDIIFSISPEGVKRLWKVIADVGDSIQTELRATSQTRTESSGELVTQRKSDIVDPRRQMVFRQGGQLVTYKCAPVVATEETNALPQIMIGMAGLGAAAGLVYLLYLYKKK